MMRRPRKKTKVTRKPTAVNMEKEPTVKQLDDISKMNSLSVEYTDRNPRPTARDLTNVLPKVYKEKSMFSNDYNLKYAVVVLSPLILSEELEIEEHTSQQSFEEKSCKTDVCLNVGLEDPCISIVQSNSGNERLSCKNSSNDRQGCENSVNDSSSRVQVDEFVDSDSRNQPVISDNINEPVTSDNRNEPVTSGNRNEPITSDNINEQVTIDIRNERVIRDNRNEPVTSDNRNEPITSDSRNEQVSNRSSLDSDSRNELLAKFVLQKADSSITEVCIYQEPESPILMKSVQEPTMVVKENSDEDLSVKQITTFQDQDTESDCTVCYESMNLDSGSSIGKNSETTAAKMSDNEDVPSPLMQNSMDENLIAPVAVSSCIQNPDPPNLERFSLKEPAPSCVPSPSHRELSPPMLDREDSKPTAFSGVEKSSYGEPSPISDRLNEESILEEADKPQANLSLRTRVVSQCVNSGTEHLLVQDPTSKLLNNERLLHNSRSDTTISSGHSPNCSQAQDSLSMSTNTPTAEMGGIHLHAVTEEHVGLELANVTHAQDFVTGQYVPDNIWKQSFLSNPNLSCEPLEQKSGSSNMNVKMSKSLSKKTSRSKTSAFRTPIRRRSTTQTTRKPATQATVCHESDLGNVPNGLEAQHVISGTEFSAPCDDHIQYEQNTNFSQYRCSQENIYNNNGFDMSCENKTSSRRRSRGSRSIRRTSTRRRRAGRSSNRGQFHGTDTHRPVYGTVTGYLSLLCQNCGNYFTPRMCNTCICNPLRNIDQVGQNSSINQEGNGYFHSVNAEQLAGFSDPYSQWYANKRWCPGISCNRNASFQQTTTNNITPLSSVYDQCHQSCTSECFTPACSAFQYQDSHGSSSVALQDSCNLVSSGNAAPGMVGAMRDVPVHYTSHADRYDPGYTGGPADGHTGHDTSYMDLLSNDADSVLENNSACTDSMENIMTACRVAKAFV